MQFFALPLIAEIGAALAGFATLAGIIRRDELDADAIFGIVFNSLIAVVFAIVRSSPAARAVRNPGTATLARDRKSPESRREVGA